jgi:hypothetical protein
MLKSSKALQFFLDNFDDIRALEDLAKVARAELTSAYVPDITDIFWKALHQTNLIGSNYSKDKHKDEIWWSPKTLYNSKSRKGLSFSFEPSWTMKTILGVEDAKYHIFLCFEPGSINSKFQQREWRSMIDDKGHIWREYSFEPFPDDEDGYLLGCSIDIEALRKGIRANNFVEIQDSLSSQIRSFTTTVLAQISPESLPNAKTSLRTRRG